jgi:hypothetical protein
MVKIKQILLDVLKLHTPNVLEFAQALADLGHDYRVCIDVKGVDEKTETLLIKVNSEHIDYARIDEVITSLGGSIHSIDSVEVHGARNTSRS